MFLRRIIFSEASNLLEIGSQRVVEASDRLKLPEHLSPYSEAEDFTEIQTAKSLYLSLFKTNKKLFYQAVFFQIIGSAFAFSTPILIHEFISRLQLKTYSTQTFYELVALAIGFGLAGAGNGLAIQHYFYRTLSFAMVTMNVLNKKLFEHSLKITAQAKQRYQVGDIVNYMSSDAETLGDSAMITIDMVNTAVLLLGGSGLLFYYMGWSATAAIIIMAILIPLTQKSAKNFLHLEEEMMTHRDSRMTLMTQILNAIRVVKYFSWEKSIAEEVSQVRDKEIAARYKVAKSEIGWGLIYSSISTLTLFAALITHYYRGYKIDLALVLTCISVFSLMEDQFGGLSRFISRFMNIFVSAKRITDFLKSDIQPSFKFSNNSKIENLEIKNLYFSYSKDLNIIKNLNLKIDPKSSLAIIGSVGSGKSTLIQLLINEIQPTQGQIIRNSNLKMGYVSQEAFIINSSLKQNLLFGENPSKERLDQAIQFCCLEPDLELLPFGLDTEIGEKGVNLSGGQKQRVSLARAFIANPDILLLDDPLSAVDPATEKILCEQLLFGAWKNKIRIVATHRISELRRFDQILFLIEDGRSIVGTYDELFNMSSEFRGFIELEKKNLKESNEVAQGSIINSSKLNDLKSDDVIADDNNDENENTAAIPIEVKATNRLTVDEDREKGSVKKDIYFTYIKSLGGDSKFRNFFIGLLFFGALIQTMTPMLQRTWLTQADKNIDPLILVLGYGLFGLLTMILTSLSSMWWTLRGISAGRLLHDKMLKSVLKSQIRFFDSTPIGRILQRFSRDMESVDIHLQWSFDSAIHTLLKVLTSFCLIVFALPLSLFVLAPILVIYYKIQNRYRRVAREVKRLDSLARSPRYAHFKETLQGLSIIRAFNAEKWFKDEFLIKLNNSIEMFYTHIMVNRWFSSRLPLIGAAISMTTAIGVVVATTKGWIGAGLSGLVTLYALEFWRYLNWGVRIFSELESRMTSVERLSFYANLPSEIDLADPLKFKEQNFSWPKSGSLEFKNVTLRYAENLPDVLKNVSFKIKSGSRVGIIGRTGSGKSTLFQAVFRFTPFNAGDILIDGFSIQDVPLEKLRQNLSVIPQDPSLFLGSLRSNIDRYNIKNDSDIWLVLEKVGLEKFVKNLPEQLNYKITEGGSNLSQGQRQLICLARALLMKVKIIFLDEATASVDIETDALIQKVIRNSLDGITLITIAHRLSTLKGYDQIIELSQGVIISDKSDSGLFEKIGESNIIS